MRCPVCGCGGAKKIYSGQDKAVSRFLENGPLDLFLFSCPGCGMLFLGDRGYDLGAVHAAYWRMLSSNMAEDCSVLDAQLERSLLDGLSAYKKAGRLLEIGCGNGRFLKEAKDRGWDVTGIEISPQASGYARQRYGLNIFTGAGDEICGKLEGSSFDIVIMIGLIEHLDSPRMLLERVVRLLRKEGILIIYTPNANSIFHRAARCVYRMTFGRARFAMERMIIAMHPLYFTSRTLRRALTDNGFRVKKIEPAGINLDFIFMEQGDLWWANSFFLELTRIMQRISRILKMQSHLLVFAAASQA